MSLVTPKSSERVSVELGVCDPQAFERIWPLPKAVTEAACSVRQDLGLLAGVTGLWDPNDPDDVDAMIRLRWTLAGVGSTRCTRRAAVPNGFVHGRGFHPRSRYLR